MTKLEAIPAPDLAAMSIKELWMLHDLFEHLADVAGDFCNQPRVWGCAAGKYADALWGAHLHRVREAIVAEMKRREPVNGMEIERRAEIIIAHLAAYGGELSEVIDEAKKAVAQLEGLKVVA